MDKKKKEVEKPKPKYYDVKVEAMIPATIIYRVLAIDENEAFQNFKHGKPVNIAYRIQHKRDLKVIIYEAGSLIIKFIKNII